MAGEKAVREETPGAVGADVRLHVRVGAGVVLGDRLVVFDEVTALAEVFLVACDRESESDAEKKVSYLYSVNRLASLESSKKHIQ